MNDLNARYYEVSRSLNSVGLSHTVFHFFFFWNIKKCKNSRICFLYKKIYLDSF
jgi:hypothetical protein